MSFVTSAPTCARKTLRAGSGGEPHSHASTCNIWDIEVPPRAFPIRPRVISGILKCADRQVSYIRSHHSYYVLAQKGHQGPDLGHRGAASDHDTGGVFRVRTSGFYMQNVLVLVS